MKISDRMSRLPAPYASDNPSKSAGRFSKFSLPNFCCYTSRLYNSYFSKPNRNLSDNNHATSHETYSVKGNISVFRDYFLGRRILKRTKDICTVNMDWKLVCQISFRRDSEASKKWKRS